NLSAHRRAVHLGLHGDRGGPESRARCGRAALEQALPSRRSRPKGARGAGGGERANPDRRRNSPTSPGSEELRDPRTRCGASRAGVTPHSTSVTRCAPPMFPLGQEVNAYYLNREKSIVSVGGPRGGEEGVQVLSVSEPLGLGQRPPRPDVRAQQARDGYRQPS